MYLVTSRFLLLLILVTFLSACDDPRYYFEVVGTGPEDENGHAIINPLDNIGNFEIRWRVNIKDIEAYTVNIVDNETSQIVEIVSCNYFCDDEEERYCTIHEDYGIFCAKPNNDFYDDTSSIANLITTTPRQVTFELNYCDKDTDFFGVVIGPPHSCNIKGSVDAIIN